MNITQNTQLEDLSLRQYREIARRCIKYYSMGCFTKRMLRDDDAVALVSSELMLAVVDYDVKRGATKNTYANNRAKYTIFKIINEYGRDYKQFIYYKDLDKFPAKPFSIYKRLLYQDIVDLTKELTDKQSMCLKLYYVKGLTMPAIADKLGISRQAVHKLIHKAVKNLKKRVA